MDNAMINLAGRELTCWSDDLSPGTSSSSREEQEVCLSAVSKSGSGLERGHPRTEARATSRPLLPSHFSSLLFTCALIGKSICWGTMWLSCHKMLAGLCSPTGSMGVHGRDVVQFVPPSRRPEFAGRVHLGGARSSAPEPAYFHWGCRLREDARHGRPGLVSINS